MTTYAKRGSDRRAYGETGLYVLLVFWLDLSLSEELVRFVNNSIQNKTLHRL
jgi:hypothetical protein